MSTKLKQSTAVEVALGPFVDSTDGVTAETALTITQAEVRLKKNGGAWAQKNETSSLTHEEAGFYECALNATDTDTLGLLRVAVNESGALPVWRDFEVLTAEAYNAMFSADGNVYGARVWMVDDDGGTTDRYLVVFLKNGQPITSGITSPAIQVIKASDGTDLIASSSMTQIGSTGLYKYDATTTARITSGAGYVAKITATIDSATRTMFQPVGRDSV